MKDRLGVSLGDNFDGGKENMTKRKEEKKVYTAPKLVAHGDIESITKGSADGGWTDAAFPAKTPSSSLTFS